MLDEDLFCDADFADGGTESVVFVVTEYGTATSAEIRGTTYNGHFPLKSFADLSSKTTDSSIAAQGETETGTLNLASQAVLVAGNVRWERSGKVRVLYDSTQQIGATASIYDSLFFQTKSHTIDNASLTLLDRCAFANCNGDNVVCNVGTMSIVDSLFAGCNDKNIVYNNGGTMTIEGSSFSHCSCAVRQTGKDSHLVIRDSIFETSKDTIVVDKQGTSSFAIGGTVTTAAQISSKIAIEVEPETMLVLDLSNYYVPNKKKKEELLDGYKTMFQHKKTPGEENLSIVVNVRADRDRLQTAGIYNLASDASGFKKTVTVRCGDKEKQLDIKDNVRIGAEMFYLKLSDDMLQLEVVFGISLVVKANTVLEEDEECIELKKLDVKKNAAYINTCGMTGSTTSCVINLAEGSTVSVSNFDTPNEKAKLEATLSKNALLHVAGNMTVSKLTSGQGTTVGIGGVLRGGTAADKVSIGKESTFSVGAIDLGDGKNQITIGSNSTATIVGGVSNIQSFTLSAGVVKTLEDKSKKQNYTTAVIVGNVEFNSAANGKLDVGKFATLNASESDVVAGDDRSLAVSVGANGTFSVAGLSGVSSIKLNSGALFSPNGDKKKQQGRTVLKTQSIVGSEVSTSSVTIGDYCDVTVDGNLEFTSLYKSSLSIGGKGTIFESADIKGLASLKIGTGKNDLNSMVSIGRLTMGNLRSSLNIGKFATFSADGVDAVSDDQKVAITVNSSALFESKGALAGINSLKISSGDAAHVTRLTASGIDGTSDNDKFSIAANAELSLDKGLCCGDGNDTLAISGGGVFRALGVVDFGDGSNSLTLGKLARAYMSGMTSGGKIQTSIGSGAEAVIGGGSGTVDGIGSLKLSAGTKASKTSDASRTAFRAGTVAFTSGNDSISVATNAVLDAKFVEMREGKDTITVSGGYLKIGCLDVGDGLLTTKITGGGAWMAFEDLSLDGGTASFNIGKGTMLKADFSNVSDENGVCLVAISGELNLTDGTWNENVLVSGNGKVTVDLEKYSDVKEKWTNTWCIGDGTAAAFYSGETSENSDNTAKTARDLKLELGQDGRLSGWLCNSESNDGVCYITDNVDCFKFGDSLSETYSSLRFSENISVFFSETGKDGSWSEWADEDLEIGGYVKIELKSGTAVPAAYTITGGNMKI